MSTIKLVAFATYTCDAQIPKSATEVRIISGASHAEVDDKGKITLTIASVPMRSNAMQKRTPDGGLLLLYGLRDTAEELQRARTEARKMGAEFAYATIEIDVGDIEVGLVDYPLMKSADAMQFMSVRRMKKDLQVQVLDEFAKHSKFKKSDQDIKRVLEIALHPNLWDDLFKAETFANQTGNAFRKLDVLIIPLADSPSATTTKGSLRHVAYVRPSAKVVSRVQGSNDVELVTP